MNLYVWNEPYRISYGSSCLYVVASTLEEARAIAAAGVPDSGYGHNPGEVTVADPKVLAKEPDRVIPVPCAEIYHWSE